MSSTVKQNIPCCTSGHSVKQWMNKCKNLLYNTHGGQVKMKKEKFE
jgi:hypothetical protein